MSGPKSFQISKHMVYEAYLRVKASKGAAGVDGQSAGQFGQDLKGNLYKLWNRMSSGCYFPPPVRMAGIPKPGGKGVRVLGVPSVADRIAQTVLAMALEPEVEKIFHPDSYGYRPHKSALDAVGTCRERCWACDWVIDLDIEGFSGNLDHDLVLKAVAHHTGQKWIWLYVQRWLKAPLQQPDGTLVARDRGSPQGSAITPPCGFPPRSARSPYPPRTRPPSASPGSSPWPGTTRGKREGDHDRCGRTPRPGQRPAPTRGWPAGLCTRCRSLRSRPGSCGPAGTHTIGARTGPPLRFQRVTDPLLVAAVHNHRNAERPQLRTV